MIAIIGVLIGLLMPALHRARTTAQQVRCASILRQWGVAFHVYADQYHGLLPHTGDRENGPTTFRQRLPVPAVLRARRTSPATRTSCRPCWGRRRGLDFPLRPEPTADIWQCPLAVALATTAYGYAPQRTGYHSYAANQYLDTNTAPLVTADGTGPGLPALPEPGPGPHAVGHAADVRVDPGPADRVRPEPRRARSTCTGRRGPDTGPAELGDRHPHAPGKLGGNLMMLDGHIEWTDHLWAPACPTSRCRPAATAAGGRTDGPATTRLPSR